MQLHSFWWRGIKLSWKKSWEPFLTVSGCCALGGGIVASLLITHKLDKEWGDYMIYWSIAIPVAVWWSLFLCNIIKAPHKIYKEDLVAARKGAIKISEKEMPPRHFVRFASVVMCVSIIVVILETKNYQIAQLERNQATAKSSESRPEDSKPLPDKIIPTNEFRAPDISKPTELSESLSQIKNSNPTNQFEKYTPATDVKGKPNSEFEKLKNYQKEQKDIADKAKQKIIDIGQSAWAKSLPCYEYTLTVIHDKLLAQEKNGDGIFQSMGYFQCLPLVINPETQETNIAEIGLQKDTNWIFTITIEPKDSADNVGRRPLRISCSAGLMQLIPDNDQLIRRLTIPYLKVPNADVELPLDKYHELIDSGLELLFESQADYLNQLNNKRDTDKINKK